MQTIETATDLAAIIETTGNSQRHTTLDEILDNVRAALDEYADDHDIYAIVDKAYAWYRAYDPRPTLSTFTSRATTRP